MKAHLVTLLALTGLAGTLSADSVIVYNTLPASPIFNMDSVAYEATSTSELGGLVQLAGGATTLDSATIAMSNWAKESTYQVVGTSTGFYVPLTLSLYNVGDDNSVGSLIHSVTVDAFIQWRPEASDACTGGRWLAANGTCYNGMVTLVTIDLGVAVPDEFIYGVAINTQHAGYSPTGESGPYNSLNFAFSSTLPSAGSNPEPGTVYLASTASWMYADGGADGLGTFRQDTGWGNYSGAIAFDTAAPEPAAGLLLGSGLLALAAFSRRRG